MEKGSLSHTVLRRDGIPLAKSGGEVGRVYMVPYLQRQSLVDNSEKHGYHAKHPEKISCELFCAQSPLILQVHTFSGPCALTVMPRFRRKVATLWREIDIKNPGCFLKHIFSINVSFNLIRIW